MGDDLHYQYAVWATVKLAMSSGCTGGSGALRSGLIDN